MDRGPKVTLGPEVEAVGAEVDMEMFGTAPQVEADGREILLRADGETFMESRVLGTPMLELLPMQRLGSLCLLLQPLLKILVGLEMLDIRVGMEMLDIKMGIERLDAMVVMGMAMLDMT